MFTRTHMFDFAILFTVVMLSDINHTPLDNHHAQIMACIHHQDTLDCASQQAPVTQQTMKFTPKIHTLLNQNVSIQLSINKFQQVLDTIHIVNHKQIPFKHINKLCNSIKIHTNHSIKLNKTINWPYKLIIEHTHHNSQHQHHHTIKAAHRLLTMIGARTSDNQIFFFNLIFVLILK